ncbi:MULTISPECIES: hypothetical protein [Mycolicibacter]|uniref:Uncharacterized protein n=2 Tax=Mycolicibacter TaxID=1073531 RepID=A0ABU5XP46_9MYCO|nr:MULTISPECIES: hypothetical protein [unclassified Mycolicibacter]MEB3023072.1 hypothetical protein [Mycolicibacter sp. MYC098]MEB3033582.1 hypothetical protein [Mycolicibacter sp. MYC340]
MGFHDFAEIRKANEAIGHFWFEHDPQRGHRIETPLLDGRYWIESQWADFDESSRCYQLVEVSTDGSIKYLLDARRFEGIDEARAELNAILG